MKTIEVVAAIIRDGNKIFATQRGYGEFKGGWEFPGGKIEANETSEQALIREIKEETGIELSLSLSIRTAVYSKSPFVDDRELDFLYNEIVKLPAC